MKNLLPFLFAAATALFWGLYGPALGKARIADPELSPFKPYVGIGLAYLVIAMVGGLIGMWIKGDTFEVGAAGWWGIAAGALGAFGAFTLTLAMFSGGARIPHAVMPIVFGGAVTVTALYSLWSSGGQLRGTPMLWVGIAGVLVSVVVITMNTPHAAPPGHVRAAHPSPDSSAPSAAEGAPQAR